jgi:pyruvate-formate lyase-activating enzyme
VEPLLDRLGRPLETLRISITDRCNFRCVYCMPKEVFGRDYQFLKRSQLLTLEEIARVARLFAGLGVRTVRITGGEPLVRRNVEHLIELLREIDGIELGVRAREGGPRRYRVRLYDPHGKVVLDHSGLATSRWRRWGYRPTLGGVYRTVYTVPGRTRRYRTNALACG